MIKDLLVSFKDNIKEKSTNPFLGTYVLVWCVRNWELIYSLFNFDKTSKLSDKVEFIKSYYSTNNFIEGILLNIVWAFGILILTFLLLNMSRFIVNLSEKRLTTWVYKITDSKSIVLKSLYENLRNNRDDLQLRLDQERDAKSKLETKIKSLEDEVSNLIKKKSSNNSPFIDNTPFTPGEVVKEIIKRDYSDEFQNLLAGIVKSDNFQDTDMINYLATLGLIQFNGSSSAGKRYKLTTEGEKVRNVFVKKITVPNKS